MARYQSTIWCDGCGIEITWAPYIEGNREYCCEDCARGFRCECGSRMEMDEERRKEQPTINVDTTI